MKISNLVGAIKPSETIAIASKALELKKQGHDVISLSAGEPDFPTPEKVKLAAIEAINKNFTKYTNSSGTIELREAIARKLKKENNLDYKISEILVSAGAKQALFNAIQSIINQGDEIIVLSPYWVSYTEQIRFARGYPVFVKTRFEDNFHVRIEDIEREITRYTTAILLNSPNNPTGVVYSEKVLKEIYELAHYYDLWVISDEIYECLVYDGNKHISIASLNDDAKYRTIVINGLSKAYSMTGWRIGYAAGNEQIIKTMAGLQGHTTSNPNSIAQYASVVALDECQEDVKNMHDEFQRRRDYIVSRLQKIPGIQCLAPEGAFYVFPKVSSFYGKIYKDHLIDGSVGLVNFLLDTAKVAVVPGNAFGADEFIRISYAASMEEIVKAMDRIEESLALLKR